MTSVLTGGLAALLTACPPTPGDGSAGPTNPPGPRLGGVTAMSPGGTGYSPRPMSADGRYVAYLRPEASTASEPGRPVTCVPRGAPSSITLSRTRFRWPDSIEAKLL